MEKGASGMSIRYTTCSSERRAAYERVSDVRNSATSVTCYHHAPVQALWYGKAVAVKEASSFKQSRLDALRRDILYLRRAAEMHPISSQPLSGLICQLTLQRGSYRAVAIPTQILCKYLAGGRTRG